MRGAEDRDWDVPHQQRDRSRRTAGAVRRRERQRLGPIWRPCGRQRVHRTAMADDSDRAPSLSDLNFGRLKFDGKPMNRTVRIRRFGAPDVLELHEEDVPALQSGMARVRHTAVGLNNLDIYHRAGHYPLPLPTGLGVAGAGVVEAVGKDVDTVAVGDRVAYAGVSPGSYADIRLVTADRLVPLTDRIDDAVAAATLQQGITAGFLLKEVFTVLPGQSVLIHA